MDGVHVSMIAGLTWNHDLCRWMKWSLGLEVAKTSTHGRQLTVKSFSKLEKVRTHHSLQVSWLDINWLRSLDLLWILAECSIRVLCGFRSIGQPMALHGSCGYVYSTPWPSRQAKKEKWLCSHAISILWVKSIVVEKIRIIHSVQAARCTSHFKAKSVRSTYLISLSQRCFSAG